MDGGYWVVTGQFKDKDLVSITPFAALHLELADLWVPGPETTDPHAVADG